MKFQLFSVWKEQSMNKTFKLFLLSSPPHSNRLQLLHRNVQYPCFDVSFKHLMSYSSPHRSHRLKESRIATVNVQNTSDHALPTAIITTKFISSVQR